MVMVLEDESKVMEDSWFGQIDIGTWMDSAEGICMRAGNLKSRLGRDDNRVARMIDNLEQNKPLLDIKNLWKLEVREEYEEGDWGIGFDRWIPPLLKLYIT